MAPVPPSITANGMRRVYRRGDGAQLFRLDVLSGMCGRFDHPCQVRHALWASIERVSWGGNLADRPSYEGGSLITRLALRSAGKGLQLMG
jgi:hypothetical protein